MALGNTLEAWLKQILNHAQDVPPLSYVGDLLKQFQGMLAGKPPDATKLAIDTLGVIPNPATLAIAMMLSSMTGKGTPPAIADIEAEAAKMMQDPGRYLSVKIAELQSNPDIQQAAQQLATLGNAAVWGPLDAIALSVEENPLKAFVELQAGIAGIKLLLHAVGVGVEILGVGQIETVDSALEDLLKSLNLEEVSARMIAPLFAAGVEPAAERFYNRKYRNQRLNIEQLIHLQALGLVPESYVNDESAAEGWRDADIEFIRQILYDRIAPGDLFAARDIGLLDDAGVLGGLHDKMFSPEAAKFMLNLNAAQRIQGWGERVFQIALRNYLNYKIGDDGLATIARQAGFSQERVDFEIALAKTTRQGQTVDLSIGQVEQAYKFGQLSDVEAVNYLQKLNVDPGGIPILIQTWKASLDKSAARLNVSQLTTAYKDGLIDEQALGEKLDALGWKPEDVRLLVRIAQWQKPTTPRTLTESTIITAWRQGVLDLAQTKQHLVALGFTDDEANLILEADRIKPHVKSRELSESVIVKLYEIGEFSKEIALDRLENLGYSADDANLYIMASVTNKPKTTTTTKPKATTPPGVKVSKP